MFGPSAQRPRGKLILGFRMEWLQPFQEAFRAATLGFEPMALGPLERAGIVEAIEGPAKAPWLRGRYGLGIANEAGQSPLAEVVATNLQADAGSAVAPTLQVLLGAMWDEAQRLRPTRPCFDRQLYERLRKGGILLRDFLDQQLNALGDTHPEAAESGFALDLLEYHTTPLGTAEGHSREELTKRYPHRIGDMESVLDRLKELYLLIESPESPGATRFAHDTLGPMVRVRFAQSLSPALRGRRILEKRDVEWYDGNVGLALNQTDLAIVEQALSGMRTLTKDEHRLLDASRAAEKQRQADEAERNARVPRRYKRGLTRKQRPKRPPNRSLTRKQRPKRPPNRGLTRKQRPKRPPNRSLTRKQRPKRPPNRGLTRKQRPKRPPNRGLTRKQRPKRPPNNGSRIRRLSIRNWSAFWPGWRPWSLSQSVLASMPRSSEAGRRNNRGSRTLKDWPPSRWS